MNHILEAQKKRIKAMRECRVPYEMEFCDQIIVVNPGVFYPGTDTELLAKTVQVHRNERVLETFAGTGAISVIIAEKTKKIVATDNSQEAVNNIRCNIQRHSLNKSMKTMKANIFPDGMKPFDVIIANPPYTDHKANDDIERACWDDGHRTVRNFLENAKNYMKPEGRIYLTWANFAGFGDIERLLKENRYVIKIIAEKESKNGNVYRVYELTTQN